MKLVSLSTFIDPTDFHDTVSILARTNEEMQRQELMWGEQNHPLHGLDIAFEGYGFEDDDRARMRESCQQRADHWKRVNDDRVARGEPGWDGILLEEVYEALAEADAEAAITELVQVAAVALQAAKSIMRNGIEGRA